MKTSVRRLTTAGALAFALASFGMVGCESDPNSLDGIRADLTPELETLHERQDDMDNNGALVWDEMGRMFVEDLGRVFYTNRPSRLTPEPVPRP